MPVVQVTVSITIDGEHCGACQFIRTGCIDDDLVAKCGLSGEIIGDRPEQRPLKRSKMCMEIAGMPAPNPDPDLPVPPPRPWYLDHPYPMAPPKAGGLV